MSPSKNKRFLLRGATHICLTPPDCWLISINGHLVTGFVETPFLSSSKVKLWKMWVVFPYSRRWAWNNLTAIRIMSLFEIWGSQGGAGVDAGVSCRKAWLAGRFQRFGISNCLHLPSSSVHASQLRRQTPLTLNLVLQYKTDWGLNNCDSLATTNNYFWCKSIHLRDN
jgi:hypothetical protein